MAHHEWNWNEWSWNDFHFEGHNIEEISFEELGDIAGGKSPAVMALMEKLGEDERSKAMQLLADGKDEGLTVANAFKRVVTELGLPADIIK